MDATAWALVSLVIFTGIMIYVKVPGMVTKSLDDRSAKIQDDLDEAPLLLVGDADVAPPVGRPDDVLAGLGVGQQEGLVGALGPGRAEGEEHHGNAGAER